MMIVIMPMNMQIATTPIASIGFIIQRLEYPITIHTITDIVRMDTTTLGMGQAFPSV